jgi:N-acetylglutamate synthase-like GNAT family acetyltransferase
VSPRYRLAAAGDVGTLAALYREAALVLGPQVYTPEQVLAWSRATDDARAFARYILDARTWIDEAPDDSARGFCGIAQHADGHGEVHSLYVRAALTRQGIGTGLLAHALADARTRGATLFSAWATPFSKPVFERAGFMLERCVVEAYQGVLFERYRMGLRVTA